MKSLKIVKLFDNSFITIDININIIGAIIIGIAVEIRNDVIVSVIVDIYKYMKYRIVWSDILYNGYLIKGTITNNNTSYTFKNIKTIIQANNFDTHIFNLYVCDKNNESNEFELIVNDNAMVVIITELNNWITNRLWAKNNVCISL